MPIANPPENVKDLCAYIVDNVIGFKKSEEFQVNWDGDCKEFSELLVLGFSSFGRFVSRTVKEAMEKPERRAALKPVIDSAFEVIEMLSTIDDDYIDTCVTTGLFEALDDVPTDALWSTIVSRLGPKSRATWDFYIPGVSRSQLRPECVVDLDDGQLR